ncbi:hypothetical protein Trydic_g9427 [Trypoxylus dichotomus]
MQHTKRVLSRIRIECEPRLSQRFFAGRMKEGTPCPPCDRGAKPAPKLPMTARQFKEKECGSCNYWKERKELRDEPPQPMHISSCRVKPCPPNTQRTVNECEKSKQKACPKGDWESPGPRNK